MQLKKTIYLISIFLFIISSALLSDSVDFVLFKLKSKNQASSTLKEKGRPDSFYGPDKATDNNQKTAWCAGNTGKGEWLSVDLGDKSTVHSNVVHVFHGIGASRELYLQNNRIKDFELEITDKNGKIHRHKGKFNDTACGEPDERGCLIEAEETEKDKKGSYEKVMDVCMKNARRECFSWPQTYGSFSGEEVILGHFICMKQIKIKILSVYPGSKYNDTCITEISAQEQVYGYSDPDLRKEKSDCEGLNRE